MTTRYGCALDGQGLQDIDPAICVTDVREEAPPLRAAAFEGLGDGSRLTRRSRPSLSVSVTFEIHEYDPPRRKAIAMKACAWARDGWLTLSDRPGQRLRVICQRLPAVDSALRWTDALTVGFTAYALPFWQEARAATASFTGRSGSAAVTPAGTRPCFLEAEITAAEPVSALTLTAGGASWTLTGLGLRTGETLSIGYEADSHRQFMRVGQRSVLACRSGESADDLMLSPRKPNSVGIEADGTVHATLKGVGLWT